jgi:hypothetical protein
MIADRTSTMAKSSRSSWPVARGAAFTP